MSYWLVGPVGQDALDLSLQRSNWPFEVRFFRADDLLNDLSAQALGILLIEPLQRLLPADVWDQTLPLLGLCSRPHQPPAIARRLLSLLDGVIALETGLAAWLSPDGPPLSPIIVWNLGPQHRPAQTPTIFARSYLLPQSWSPQLPLYESLAQPPDYFIQVHPGRLPFYLQRSRLVLSDARLNAQYFQALACGACLLVHRRAPEADQLATWLKPEEDFVFYDENDLEQRLRQPSDPGPDLKDRLEALRLEQTLPRALASLAGLSAGSREAEAQLLQLASLTDPQALIRLRDGLPGAAGEQARLWLELNFMQQLQQSPYAQTDAQQLAQAQQLRLSLLPPSPEKRLVQAWEAIQRADYAEALNLLPAQAPAFARLTQTAAWQLDPLLRELQSLHEPQAAFEAWLAYRRALCLAHTQRFEAAAAELMGSLQQSYSPVACDLWLALDLQPDAATCASLLQKHPQHLELARHLIAALTREGRRAEALATCRRYQQLSRRYQAHAQAFEKFLALESQLDPAPAEGIYVLWEGPLHSHSSLANINRHWMLRLQQQPDIRVTHVPYDPPEWPPTAQTAGLSQSWRAPVDVFVSHHWPPRQTPPAAGKWAGIVPWEFGVIPQSWAQSFNAHIDRIWVPSRFVAQSFEISGVEPDRLAVIPNGIDPECLRPAGEVYPLSTAKAFRFLFVGGLLSRKGVDLLLEAYAQAFDSDDDVCLVIKAFGNDGQYALQSFQQRLDALRRQPRSPELLLIEDDLSPQDLAALYRACNVYVHPYRGEGFGMPILEAMACGLPVMVPNAGPAPEFCPPAAGWFIPTRVRFEASRDVQGLGLAVGPPYYAEPDVPSLAAYMRTAAADADACRQKGLTAAAAAEAYSWERLFPLVLNEIQTLSARRIARGAREAERYQHWQAVAEGSPAAECLALLSEDPGLLEGLWPYLQPQQQSEAWRRSLAAGLPTAEILRLARTLPGRWKGLPLRLCWPMTAPMPLARPRANDRLSVLTSSEHADFSLSLSGDAGPDLLWLLDCQLPQQLPTDGLLCYSDEAQRPALLSRGLRPDRLFWLPLSVDFSRFSPSAEPLQLEESVDRFVFLSIFDWDRDGGWQDLLRAYFDAFAETEPVNLIFKPLGADFETMVAELMAWIEAEGFDAERVPSLTFVQEELDPEQLPGLYRGADCFVAAHAGSGIWHLAAQASAVPVISCGHFGFLARPFSEVFNPGDIAQLSWLLRQHWLRPEAGRGMIVREFLQAKHDIQPWQNRLENILIQSYFSE